MKDHAWKTLIERAVRKCNEADRLKRRAEAEYVRRYGVHPSDIDDDWWIDALEYGTEGAVNIEQIKANAEMSVRAAKDKL